MTPEVICHLLCNENIVQCLSNQLQEGVEKVLELKKTKKNNYLIFGLFVRFWEVGGVKNFSAPYHCYSTIFFEENHLFTRNPNSQ